MNRKKTTKLIGLLLTLAVIFVFFIGCGGNKNGEDENITDLPEYPAYSDENEGIDFTKKIGNLAENGISDYKIAISSEATAAEKNAANELRSYTMRVTGANMEIVTDNESLQLGQKYISVGGTALFEASQIDVSDLNIDGFRIKTVEDTVIIKGERDRGTLYGVYDFLEKVLGVKFLTAIYEHIPKTATVPLYAMDIVQIPDFMSRGHFVTETSNDLTFGAKMRTVTPTNPKQSSRTEYVGGAFFQDFLYNAHSYVNLLPYATYYRKHPEWYTTTGSDPSRWQLVLSNGLNDDGTIKKDMGVDEDGIENNLILEMVKNIKRDILANPTVKYVYISQNDYAEAYSDNPNCIRQRSIFGNVKDGTNAGHSAHNIVFVNAIAREIKSWLPQSGIEHDINFITLAYHYNLAAPVIKTDNGYEASNPLAIPRDDVYIMFAPLSGSYNEPIFDDSPSSGNSDIASHLNGWRGITDRFFFYDYTINFREYLLWYPNTSILSENARFYKEMGVKGVTSNGPLIGSPNFYQSNLNTYILSKLHWNVDRDVNALIHEFNRYYFGEAAGAAIDDYVVYQNVHFTEAASKGVGGTWQSARCYTGLSPWLTEGSVLSPHYTRESMRIYDRAAAALAADTSLTDEQRDSYENNLITVLVQIKYSMYKHYRTFYKVTDSQELEFMKSFYEDLKRANITFFEETQDQSKSISAIFERDWGIK